MSLSEAQISTRLLHVREAAERLGLSKTKTHQLITSGDLEARKIGRRTLIPDTAVESFIRDLPRAGQAD